MVAVRRCPKCHNLSIEADVQKARAYCTRCGFEMIFKVAKN